MRCFNSMMHSMDMSLSKLWETVKYIWEPGMLQSMGLQRVSHILATEKQQKWNLRQVQSKVKKPANHDTAFEIQFKRLFEINE